MAETHEARLPLDDSLRTCSLPWADRLASWERLRTFGRLPLFGVSFSALVAIPSVAFGLAAYNEQIERLRDWASRGDVDALRPALGEVLRQLHPVPLPSLTFWLLVSTLLLGCASLIYSLLCPPWIKEFSLERWTDKLRHTALHYLPLSWRYRPMRLIAGACYIVGGIGTLATLLVKLWNAGEFVISNTTLPWYLWRGRSLAPLKRRGSGRGLRSPPRRPRRGNAARDRGLVARGRPRGSHPTP